jgi:hypothetical protein
MSKYGLFSSEVKQLQQYEGDYMHQDKQFVYNKSDLQVAAIHLDAGQSVKKISD